MSGDKQQTKGALADCAITQVCADCGAVDADCSWRLPQVARAGQPPIRPAVTTICPACQAIREARPGGYVHLSGGFLAAHYEEVEQLLSSEAARAEVDNPLARISGWQEGAADELTVTTTTGQLAQRLGHALEKAFNGEARYSVAPEDKLAHVWWRRA